jgi:hypothetical protein
MLEGPISTYFNKDTCDLFMLCLCIMLMCQLYRVLFYSCCSIILLLFDFHSMLFIFCTTFVRLFFPFDSLLFNCSLLMRKKYSMLILDCIPGISIPLYVKYPSSSPSMQVNKHHTSDCTIFV